MSFYMKINASKILKNAFFKCDNALLCEKGLIACKGYHIEMSIPIFCGAINHIKAVLYFKLSIYSR